MDIATGVAACTIVGTVGILVHVLARLKRRQSSLPNGPPGNWITGNMLDFFSHYQWMKFAAWSKIYGDIIYLTVLGRPIVVCNRFEDARELMDRRGVVYSDRMRMVHIVDVLHIRSVTFMEYGSTWRAHRKLMQQHLNSRAIVAFRPLQFKLVASLLKELLVTPESFWKHIKHFVASVVLSTTYGYMRANEIDSLLELNARAERSFVLFGPPGATAVDFFPFLRFIGCYLPGSSSKKIVLEARESLQEMCIRPYETVKKQRATSIAAPSLLSHMLDDAERQGIDSESHCEDIKDVCGAMYRAGVGTTSTLLHIFVLAMVLHPHIAQKAQKELDAVLNGGRLPSLKDQESFPYVTCILKECLRWAPPFPLGIAHRAMKDGELNGKHIPKGSMIVPNIWYMMHDERNYVEPEIFNPDRFMKFDAGGETAHILDPTAAVFGFGRRICPGRHFAEATSWLAMASILAVFDILPATDENGIEHPPKAEFIPRLNSWSLKEFSCRFVPRSENAAIVVKNLD